MLRPLQLAVLVLAGAWVLRGLFSEEPGQRPAVVQAVPATPRSSAREERIAPSFPPVATTPAELRQVVHACRAAGPEAVHELQSAALSSPDPLVVGNALRALGRLGAVSGDAELEALLSDPRRRVRQELVLALGRSRDPAAAERLLLPLLDGGQTDLRPLAIRSLALLGTSAGRARLEALPSELELTEVERALLRDLTADRLAPPAP